MPVGFCSVCKIEKDVSKWRNISKQGKEKAELVGYELHYINTDSDSVVVVDDSTFNQETNNIPSKNFQKKHNKKNKFGQEDVLEKITSFASDGASVMLRVRNGVAKQLTSYCPYMVVTHCVAHHLALASETLAKGLYSFLKNSSKRLNSLKEFQEILDNDILKIKKIFDIRWLSWYEAVRNICKSLEALILTLSNDVSEVSKPLLNIEIIINTIINKLRFEYLPDNNGNIKFGFHLRKFFNNLRLISETRVDFGEFQLNYSYNDHQELLVDIQTYTRDQFGMEKNIKQKDNSYKKFEPLVDK
ncbi:12640_t:CDS:2 [Entrophospora sp. SA101]|nr:12640_t:CDS:2 [Entrophospora sp. SA101]